MIPTLPELLRHSAALPLALRPDSATTQLRAVMRDLLEMLSPPAAVDDEFLHAFSGDSKEPTRRSYFGWVMAAAHVLAHPSLRPGDDATVDASLLRRLLLQELATLSSIVMVRTLDQDEERREELIRRCLRALGQRLPGETERDAEDRLRQIDSIERHEVLAAAAEREARALAVREAMTKKAAEEAVPKVGRE